MAFHLYKNFGKFIDESDEIFTRWAAAA